MQSMTDKKRDFETACAAAVKARNFTEAAKAASGAADCAEILASRTTGVIAEAYLKEVESWRVLAGKLEARKGRAARGDARPPMRGDARPSEEGDEWLVGEKPNITFDDIAGMEDAKRVLDEMVIYPMKSPEKARALGLNPGDGVSCSKVGESYYGGTLVVTNKRVFFMSPTHQQVYRLRNLIEYFSDWDYYNGTIKLSTSERRSEQYQMPGVWKAAFVISFFCDPMFRQSILQGSEGQAKATILSKVEASITRGPSYSGNLLEEKTDGRRRSSGSDDPFKNYIDISDKGFVGGMVASFVAGTQVKGVITAWDKQTWYKPKGRNS